MALLKSDSRYNFKFTFKSLEITSTVPLNGCSSLKKRTISLSNTIERSFFLNKLTDVKKEKKIPGKNEIIWFF